jgi:hypothetical protein
MGFTSDKSSLITTRRRSSAANANNNIGLHPLAPNIPALQKADETVADEELVHEMVFNVGLKHINRKSQIPIVSYLEPETAYDRSALLT